MDNIHCTVERFKEVDSKGTSTVYDCVWVVNVVQRSLRVIFQCSCRLEKVLPKLDLLLKEARLKGDDETTYIVASRYFDVFRTIHRSKNKNDNVRLAPSSGRCSSR